MRIFSAGVMSLVAAFCLLTPANAQFRGPTAQGTASTVAATENARLGTYVTLTGNILSHLRSDYFTFSDGTGEMRVEIEPNVWRNREVTPTTKVRILGEVDNSFTGRYLWVKTLDIVE